MTENRELASALMSCQDELSHMNEKLLLTEDAGIKLTTKCKELAAFTEPLINKTPTKLDMESVFKKITDLVDMQKDNEKSLIDHDRSRFQVQNNRVAGTYLICHVLVRITFKKKIM